MVNRIVVGLLAVMMFCSIAYGETTYKKIDDFRIEKTEVKSSTEVNTFEVNFLTEQKKNIESQRDAYAAARNVEIAEVDTLLAECAKAGITAKEKENAQVIP